MRTNRWRMGAAVCAAMLLTAACGAGRATPPADGAVVAQPAAGAGTPTQAAEPPPRMALKTAYTTASASVAPLWVAIDGGAFDEQGIDAEMTFVAAGQAILGAISSQETPIVMAGANQALDANLQGGEYIILGAAMPYLTNSIYVVPEIQRPEDLRGKTVGVSNFGAISHVALKVALEHWGLEEGTDVTVIRSGGTPETLAAMQSGSVQGGSFSPPQTFKARDLGFRQLLDVASLQYDIGSSAIVASRPYVAQHPDVAERYLKALIKGAHLFQTNKDLAVAAIMQYGRIDDRGIAEETWNYYRDKVSDDMVMSLQAIRNNLKILEDHRPEAATAQPEQFVDNRFVERIKASGYVQQVKRGS